MLGKDKVGRYYVLAIAQIHEHRTQMGEKDATGHVASDAMIGRQTDCFLTLNACGQTSTCRLDIVTLLDL